MSKSQDTLIIDPVRMHIVNRVAEGSTLRGEHRYSGGLLLQGALQGSGEIGGRLVVWHDATLEGEFRVLGDLYVFGRIGAKTRDQAADPSTRIECHGTVYLASTAVCTGEITATRLHMYDGASLQGPFSSLKAERTLPVLND